MVDPCPGIALQGRNRVRVKGVRPIEVPDRLLVTLHVPLAHQVVAAEYHEVSGLRRDGKRQLTLGSQYLGTNRARDPYRHQALHPGGRKRVRLRPHGTATFRFDQLDIRLPRIALAADNSQHEVAHPKLPADSPRIFDRGPQVGRRTDAHSVPARLPRQLGRDVVNQGVDRIALAARFANHLERQHRNRRYRHHGEHGRAGRGVPPRSESPDADAENDARQNTPGDLGPSA